MQGGFIIMMQGLWYKVPADLFNSPYITKADMAVFAYVADRLKDDERAVSLRSIQAATELSRRQVQLSLHKLVECRFLSATERPGRATLYKQLLIPKRRKEVQEDEYTMEPSISADIENAHVG